MRRFAAAIDSGRIDAAACELLTTDLRDATLGLSWGIDDGAGPDGASDAGLDRHCDADVAVYNGWTAAGGPGAARFRVTSVRTVAKRAGVVHLRVTTHWRGSGDGGGDVFLQRTAAGWRLAWPGLLWALSPQPTVMPVDLRTFRRHLWELRARARAARATRARLARAVSGSGVALTQGAMAPLSGRASQASDLLNDLVDDGGTRLPGQPADPVDLTGAALSLDGATLMLQLQFRGPVPDASLHLELSQNFDHPTATRPLSVGGFDARLNGGTVNVWADAGTPAPVAGPAVHAVVDGTTLQLTLPALRAAGSVDLSRPLRWSVTARSTQSGATVAADTVPRLPAHGVGGVAYMPG